MMMMVIMILSLNEVSDDGDDGDFLFPTEVQVPRGLLLVRQLKDGFHHQGAPPPPSLPQHHYHVEHLEA